MFAHVKDEDVDKAFAKKKEQKKRYTDDEVRDIRSMYETHTNAEIAAKYGKRQKAGPDKHKYDFIYGIISKTYYASVPDVAPPP